jgi:hypothetical protein
MAKRKSGGSRKLAIKGKTLGGFKSATSAGNRFTTKRKSGSYVPIGAEGLGAKVTPASTKYKLVKAERKRPRRLDGARLLEDAKYAAQRHMGKVAYAIAAAPLA